MRRTLVITTIAATALGLSACGGAPKDLSQDKAKSSMLEAGDLPDGGWEAGSVDETKPKQDDKSAEQIFKNAKDVPQACKDAMNAMSTMSADNPSSYANRSFTLVSCAGTSLALPSVSTTTSTWVLSVPLPLVKLRLA